jgi:hypothetical protein
MKARAYSTMAKGIFLAVLLPVSVAQAQLGNLLNQGAGDGSSGGLGGLGGIGNALSGQSITSGSASNVAGVLQFCIKNNYLGGSSASSVKDSLMSKLPGGSSSASSDRGYTNGAKGILSSR